MSTLAASVQTQNGTKQVMPPTNANWTTVSVTFSPQFTVVPIVAATTINEATLPDTFAVTVYNVTA